MGEFLIQSRGASHYNSHALCGVFLWKLKQNAVWREVITSFVELSSFYLFWPISVRWCEKSEVAGKLQIYKGLFLMKITLPQAQQSLLKGPRSAPGINIRKKQCTIMTSSSILASFHLLHVQEWKREDWNLKFANSLILKYSRLRLYWTTKEPWKLVHNNRSCFVYSELFL